MHDHAGRREEAASDAREAARIFERKGNVVSAERARALCADPSGTPGR